MQPGGGGAMEGAPGPWGEDTAATPWRLRDWRIPFGPMFDVFCAISESGHCLVAPPPPPMGGWGWGLGWSDAGKRFVCPELVFNAGPPQ